jgi:hypothetical protein
MSTGMQHATRFKPTLSGPTMACTQPLTNFLYVLVRSAVSAPLLEVSELLAFCGVRLNDSHKIFSFQWFVAELIKPNLFALLFEIS